MSGAGKMPGIHAKITTIVGGLTAYQIAQIISAETDPTTKEFKRINQRWQRWLKGESLGSLKALEEDLDSLGFEIVIKELIK